MSNVSEKTQCQSVNIVTRYGLKAYTDAIENHNPVYSSREEAARMGFNDVIVPPTFHAQFTPIKLAIGAAGWVPQGAVNTRLELQFCGIVKVGDYLYTSVETEERADEKSRKCIDYIYTVTNQHGDVVCKGKLTNMIL